MTSPRILNTSRTLYCISEAAYNLCVVSLIFVVEIGCAMCMSGMLVFIINLQVKPLLPSYRHVLHGNYIIVQSNLLLKICRQEVDTSCLSCEFNSARSSVWSV